MNCLQFTPYKVRQCNDMWLLVSFDELAITGGPRGKEAAAVRAAAVKICHGRLHFGVSTAV